MDISLKKHTLQSGLTIIEVMTSIVVAMIGVMGVMILVPFAVRQAQTGMDTEAAAVVARNAYSEFEIGGYRNYGNWIVWDTTTSTLVSASKVSPEPISIDPLGITESGSLYTNATFPFNLGSVYPPNYQIRAGSLSLPTTALQPFTKWDARRMFQSRDDLIFGEPQNSTGQTDAQLNGPTQVFDVETTSNSPVRRQAASRFSWSVIAVPNKLPSAPISSVSNWKLHMLVYKDRVADARAADTTPINFAMSPKMRAARVTFPNHDAHPVSTIRIDASTPAGSIRKDEWVMLVNRKQVNANAPVFNPVANGYDWQIAFCRVVNYSPPVPPSTESILTLDGPNFDFDPNVYQSTYCVHLKDVVAVFERTIVPEGNSVWNLAF
jgi:hypothetical protein